MTLTITRTHLIAFLCSMCVLPIADNYGPNDFQRRVTTHLEQGADDSLSGVEGGVMDVQGTDTGLTSASPPVTSTQGHSRSSTAKVFRCRQCSFVAPTKVRTLLGWLMNVD